MNIFKNFKNCIRYIYAQFKIRKIHIETSNETINYILKNKSSICRYGDGEFALILGGSIPFQKYSPEISGRLKEILVSNDENILIGIPGYFSQKKCDGWVDNYKKQYLYKIIKCLNLCKRYYSSTFTTPYVSNFIEEKYDEYYRQLRRIWENRDIIVVLGEGIFESFKYNIFDNAQSIIYYETQKSDAFEKYNDIYNDLIKYPKDRLIIIVLGPTATILAYDMAKSGYQALDLGHVAKDYDYYKCGKEKCVSFFEPD